MKLITSIISLLFSYSICYAIMTFVFFNIIGPLLYVPYVLYKICKKDLKPKAILSCLVAPIVWSIGFVIILFLLGLIISHLSFNSDIASIILSCVLVGGALGAASAFCAFIKNIFSKQARKEFESKLSKFKVIPPNFCNFCGSKKNVHRFNFYGGDKDIIADYGTFVCEKCVPVCSICGGFIKNKLIKTYLEQIRIDDNLEECDSLDFCDCSDSIDLN